MRKKFSFLIATNLLLLLLVPSIGIADIDEDVMTAGDTFIYSVKTFDIPWNELFASTILPFPLEDLVLDLSGSTLGVKVMAVDDNDGVYALNSYVILEEDITIPLPEDAVPSEVREIFGDPITIPGGIGIGIGQTIPGSDFLDFIDSQSMEEFALPFYLDPDEWNEYEEFFDDLDDMLDEQEIGVDIGVTNDGDEFIVTIGGQGPGIEIDIDVVWHRTGDHKGMFKSIKGSITAEFGGGYMSEPYWSSTEEYNAPSVVGIGIGSGEEVTLEVEISFDEKRHNPLPDEILDEEDITLVMDKATLDYTADGFFDENQFDSFFDMVDEAQEQLDDAEGDDIFVFDVTDVEGCFYETDIEVYEGEESRDVWWNGFTGVSSGRNDPDLYGTDYPWAEWQFYFSPGIVPMAAPGITPDWDMWRASTLSISSILEIVEATVTSSTAESELEDVGLTINEFDITYEMRTGDGLKFFFLQGDFDIELDGSELMLSGGIDTTSVSPYADAVGSVKMWLAYTTKGLIAGMGTDIYVEANFEDWPYDSEYNYETYQTEYTFDDGSITLDLEVELRNEDIEEIADPEDLPKDEGENGGNGITPGFSIIPALLMFAAVAVIIKRRR